MLDERAEESLMAPQPPLPQSPEEEGRSLKKMVAATGATFIDFALTGRGLEIVVADRPTKEMAAYFQQLYDRCGNGKKVTVTVSEHGGSPQFLLIFG